MIQPGWGRQGIAYGRYQRTNGLALAVLMLNGHNTSQVETMEWLYKRIPQWFKGSETESVLTRVIAWSRSRHKQGTIRRLRGWLRIAAEVTKFFPLTEIDDNLDVGWFADAVPDNPAEKGNGFIVRATGAENGELLAKVGTNLLSIFRGLQNVPVYYVVILRENGAAYYAASIPQVYGLPAYPELRPVAIDAIASNSTMYVGIHQSVLGQIGFRADTRVYGVKVETISKLATWYGTAHVADSWVGLGNLQDTPAEVGGSWQVLAGNFERSENGLRITQSNSLAVLDPGATSGLIHLVIVASANAITTGNSFADTGIIWRFQDQDNYWCCRLAAQHFCLELFASGQRQEIYTSTEACLNLNEVTYLQIADDGQEIRIYLNGSLIGNQLFKDKRLSTAMGVGLSIDNASPDLYLKDFEAHPRTVTITELDLGIPWWQQGREVVIKEDFNSWQGDLAGKTTLLGNKVWQKTIGKGVFKIQSGMAKVDADVKYPNPGRTAYTVAWDNSGFADVEVTIIPPGKERGQGEKGRGGLIFWQDKDNYIIINTWLDDFYEGESISCFFRIDGFEEIYDAVWSNIGQAVAFGQPYTLRVVFDGNNYTVRVNHQTVLSRALTDVYPWATALNITRLGIIVNWEWGNDTGSGFSNFVVKSN